MKAAWHAASHQSQRTQRIARNVVFLSGAQVLSTILGIALASALGRTLGPADFGVYYIIVTIMSFASVIVDWGQSNLVVREIATGRDDEAHFLGSAALIRTAGVFLTAVASLALTLTAGYPALIVWLTPLALLFTLPAVHAQLMLHFFRGRDRMDLDAVSGLIMKSVAVCATVLALYKGGGVAAAVLMPALGGLAGLAFALAMARRLDLTIAVPVAGTVRETISAGSALVVMSLSITLQPFLDVMLVSILTNSTVVGWLGAARTILGLFLTPAAILATASFPDMCRVAHSPMDLSNLLSASSRLLLAVAALGFCGVYSFADVAVTIIYSKSHFDPAATLLTVFAPFFPLFFFNFLIGNAALALGKNIEIAVAKFAVVALSTAMGWFLVTYFQSSIGNGAMGITVSFCAVEILMTLVYIAILPRGVLGLPIWGHLLRAYVAAAAVLVPAAYIVPIVAIWISVPFVVIAFLIAALTLGLVKVEDFRALAELISSGRAQSTARVDL
ncbi:MAG: oligosaccharide flippase family protein [Hyphomicrobiaceae bacterium]|uniref:oligosaccharide flippase family protein n=1 Tax=Pseudorhodoplanes sp. TaxID=1934341 RepID=UPI003D0AB337